MMEPTTEGGSGSGVIAGRDWSGLPEEILVSFLVAMDVRGAVRCGAVCTSWNAGYGAFRRLRAPLPRQPLCLLYASGALAPGVAALHCPSTGTTLRIPFPGGPAPLARRPLLGSGHGWVVPADEVSNLHLVNPVTGAQAALPPVTALHNVKMGTDERGDSATAYAVCEGGSKPTILGIGRAHEEMYDRMVLSASPSAGRACVVLLLHMPGDVSFARLGDDRWSWVAPGGATGLPLSWFYKDALYSDVDGLFYLLDIDSSMYSLDLNVSSPVARKILDSVPASVTLASKYLVRTPAGDILQVWRFRDQGGEDEEGSQDEEQESDPCLVEFNNIGMEIYKVNLHAQRLELMKGLPDYALFLGFNASMCLPVKDFDGLKSSCAYITDDCSAYVNFMKDNRRECWYLEYGGAKHVQTC